MVKKSILTLFIFLLCGNSLADTHTAADCEQATVATILADETFVAGDTLSIPEGTCTWNSGVTVDDAKKVTVTGAGLSTVITFTLNNGTYAIDLGYSGSELKSIYLKLSGGTSSGGIRARGEDWLIHDTKIESTNGLCTGILAAGGTTSTVLTGVIYQNTFIDTKPVIAGDLNLFGDGTTWSTDSAIGTANNVFIEGNTITRSGGNCVDSNYGGKYVFRYNTCNVYAEAHSVQGDERGARSWETYNNQINGASMMAFLRGGTGVMFNNTSSQTSAVTIDLDNVRSFEPRGTYALQCDGTSDNWDGAAANGYPCRDQIGRGKDASAWSNPATQGPAQALEPAYFWNNKYNGTSDVAISIANGCGDWIQENRDYYTSAKAGYTPYTCPHPLTGLTGSCNSSLAGTSGYNITNSKATIGSGAGLSIGAGCTMTVY